MPDEQGQYLVKTVCNNCGHEAESVIKMGVAVDEAKCENCGVKGRMTRKWEE